MEIGGTNLNIPDSIPHGGLGLLETLLQRTVPVFLFAGICLVLIYIVWGGIQWITASGDKQKLTNARSKITWAVIGLIVIFLSFAIVGAVGYFFKVNLLDLTQ